MNVQKINYTGICFAWSLCAKFFLVEFNWLRVFIFCISLISFEDSDYKQHHII